MDWNVDVDLITVLMIQCFFLDMRRWRRYRRTRYPIGVERCGSSVLIWRRKDWRSAGVSYDRATITPITQAHSTRMYCTVTWNLCIENIRNYNFCFSFCWCFGTEGSILMWTPVTHNRLVVSSQICKGNVITNDDDISAMCGFSQRSKRKRASERAVMIRAPMAIAEFTIRSLAPLTNKTKFARLVSKTQVGERAVALTGPRGRGTQCSWMPKHQHSARRRGTRA